MARRQIGSNDAAERALHNFQTILATGAEQPSIDLTKGVNIVQRQTQMAAPARLCWG